jgi:hypothetical protein
VAPLKIGDVAVTSAGALPARYVLHAVTVDWESRVRPSDLTIRFVAENVFRRCELLAVRHVAVPALGMGAARFTADHSARLIVEALARHSLGPTTIERVTFSLPDPEALGAFALFLQHSEKERVRATAADAVRIAVAPRLLPEDTGFAAATSSQPPAAKAGPPITSPTRLWQRLFSRNRKAGHQHPTPVTLDAELPLFRNELRVVHHIQ